MKSCVLTVVLDEQADDGLAFEVARDVERSINVRVQTVGITLVYIYTYVYSLNIYIYIT